MLCPYCAAENIAGSEICEACGHDLADLDLPTPTTHLQQKIMEDPLEKLHPAMSLLIPPDTCVTDAIELMKEKRYGCVFVTESERLIGIFTERDILHKLIGRSENLSHITVREVMTANPETLTETDTVAFALNKMSVGNYRHLPITKGEQPLGLVSVRGILKYISHNLL
jgi:CBS domain-containing protein